MNNILNFSVLSYILYCIVIMISIFIIIKYRNLIKIQKKTIDNYIKVCNDQKEIIQNLKITLENRNKLLNNNGYVFFHSDNKSNDIPDFNEILKLVFSNLSQNNNSDEDKYDLSNFENSDEPEPELKLDDILQKIHDQGINSLTEKEKIFLNNKSK